MSVLNLKRKRNISRRRSTRRTRSRKNFKASISTQDRRRKHLQRRRTWDWTS